MSGRMSSRSGNDFSTPAHLLRIDLDPLGQTDLARNFDRALDAKLLLGLFTNADCIARLQPGRTEC